MILRGIPVRAIGLALLPGLLAACSQGVDIDALRAQIGHAPVVMLSTSTCGYCKRLRADLREWGIAYDDLDVESNPRARQAYHEVSGRGVPILVVGDSVVHGYSPARARELLRAADLLPESQVH